MHAGQGTRLDSWKAIAEYLRKDVRTVTRWARERRLPVHRVPGGKRAGVFAFIEEIDSWLLNQNGARAATEAKTSSPNGIAEIPERVPSNVPQSPQVALPTRSFSRRLLNWRVIFAAGLLLAVVVGGALMLRSTSDRAVPLFSIKYDTDALQGSDAEGRRLWTYRYPSGILNNYFAGDPISSPPVRIADYFRDGRREAAAIVPLHSGPNQSEITHSEVDIFSSQGELLWSYAPEMKFQFGTNELNAPWHFMDLFVSESETQTSLWAAATHHTWGNSFVVEIEPRTGQSTLRFVNTGVLYRLKELRAEGDTFLLAGGFNNEWDSGSLAIINENRPFSVSPQTPGTRHYCNSCPPGVADYYFVFPRSEISRASNVYEDPVFEIRVFQDGIELRKYERIREGTESTYYLLSRKPPFTLLSLRYDSAYEMLHRRWSAEGKLNHSLENCPEQLHPQPVRLWTPSGGWTDMPVKPATENQ